MVDGKIIRCNYCEHLFCEEQLFEEEELDNTCPDCEVSGCLMDMGEFGKTPDEELFPLLTKCKDWGQLKEGCPLENLLYFENEIHDCENNCGDFSEPCEDYPLVIQWFEGLVDTEELIEHYEFF